MENGKIYVKFSGNQSIMIESPISKVNNQILNDAFNEIEKISNSDVIVFCSEFNDDVSNLIKELIEKGTNAKIKHNNLVFILTTNGGALSPVIRIVNVLRHFYKTIDYYVVDYAYSAGTILCCSGDRIFMDYNSVLGPIDPQVLSKDGRHFVSALGYLDKLDELLLKAKDNTITKPEFMILKDFDLGEWKNLEQAKELAIDLLSEWLPKYKFKDWKIHKSTKQKVTAKDKKERARKIAEELSNNNKWKSHGRPINRDELEKLKLHIDRMEDNVSLYSKICEYNSIMVDYMRKNGLDSFIQTKAGTLYGRKQH